MSPEIVSYKWRQLFVAFLWTYILTIWWIRHTTISYNMSPIEKIVFLPVAGCGRTGPVASGSWAVLELADGQSELSDSTNKMWSSYPENSSSSSKASLASNYIFLRHSEQSRFHCLISRFSSRLSVRQEETFILFIHSFVQLCFRYNVVKRWIM